MICGALSVWGLSPFWAGIRQVCRGFRALRARSQVSWAEIVILGDLCPAGHDGDFQGTAAFGPPELRQ